MPFEPIPPQTEEDFRATLGRLLGLFIALLVEIFLLLPRMKP